MGIFSLPWSLTGALLLTSYFHSPICAANPSINVGLKTSFFSAPYLLELLETAADENATSYYPLLDQIADGYFARATTDQELYQQFIQVLKDEGHMSDPDTLSSYQFALSMRSSAPRIEAHYQYYHTAVEPALIREQDSSCPVWVHFGGKQYCSPALDKPHGDVKKELNTQELQFDRTLGNPALPVSILYADILSPTFGPFHKTLVETARNGKTSYRLRHRKPSSATSRPLLVPGYGVELALKRTDYIVIDDRESNKAPEAVEEKDFNLEQEDIADLKPLSTSELRPLGLKASSYIMQSEDPLDTLIKLTQDFPKYSSALLAHNATADFLREHQYNRAQMVPSGYNVWWMNGVQMIERNIEALTLLELIRKERTLINGVRELGLSDSEAIELLSHEAVATVTAEIEPQRYNWKDDLEEGNVIIWLNDIEKDKRYADMPSTVKALLQRTYPGQIPQLRKEAFNLVVPVDLSNQEDIRLVAEVLASFVKRRLTLHIGIVPLVNTAQSTQQAQTIYHLHTTYGLSAVVAYLEASMEHHVTQPDTKPFGMATEGRKLREDKSAKSIDEVLKSEEYNVHIDASRQWATRLSASGINLPIFVNGVAVPRDENWLQMMSNRIAMDLQSLQSAIFKEIYTDEDYLPNHFLSKSIPRRNALIAPEDEKNITIFDLSMLLEDSQEALATMPCIRADASSKTEWAHIIVAADLSSQSGRNLLQTALGFREANHAIELIIIHNGLASSATSSLYDQMRRRDYEPFKTMDDFDSALSWEQTHVDDEVEEASIRYWQSVGSLLKSVGVLPGEEAILLNGRLIGPIPDGVQFVYEDFAQLVNYERSKRITPAYKAIEGLGLLDKITDPLAAAKMTSIIAKSTISDIPDGIFEQASTLRMGSSTFGAWNSSHTAFEIGDITTASIQMTLSLNPASERGQKWVPILKVLSELEGLYFKIYLNPVEQLSELPVKRFYRYVLDSKPTFDENGALKELGATFTGVPQDALLTLSLDIPPAWLVAPKDSIHDLDNIKLSSIKTDIEALYELENILIEGHSREIPGGMAPRGAQLLLATERDPRFADTIIMANIGYFQFKANPGYYKINLKDGRSSEIYNVDSLGAKGWTPLPGDEGREVVLMSFAGTTLYPRLSRRPGMEMEDVLEQRPESAMDYVSRGLNFAQGMLSGESKNLAAKEEQAEINIFSVASGHLYERMLNIMMVSVMKHTKHTVKFWFIEQFLSPSFKDFIPHLAAEYGFKYEMVTYKWPHWLRKQTEKQREIWGYKILFLDVLFPLSLDKVIFVDADQIVRTDMIELVNLDLHGAPYGFTPMCDSRTEMEGFRFWKQGYWEKFLRGLPYHISALYVVDLQRFRQMAAGDRLRQQYHQLSADPGSLSNLDQDLPNHMQQVLPIFSLPQEWLWCETWCSDESLADAKTIDLCNNPMTKEPKLERARRQVPEWTVYDEDIAAVDRRRKGLREEVKDDEGRNTKSRNHVEL